MAGGMKKDGRSPSFSCADRSFHCCKITAEILSGFRIIHAGGQAVFDEAETKMFKPIRIIDLNRQDYAIFGDFSGNGVTSRKFHKLLVRHVRGQLHFRERQRVYLLVYSVHSFPAFLLFDDSTDEFVPVRSQKFYWT